MSRRGCRIDIFKKFKQGRPVPRAALEGAAQLIGNAFSFGR